MLKIKDEIKRIGHIPSFQNTVTSRDSQKSRNQCHDQARNQKFQLHNTERSRRHKLWTTRRYFKTALKAGLQLIYNFMG